MPDIDTGDAADSDTGTHGARLDAISAELDGIGSELDTIEADLATRDAQPVNPFALDPVDGPLTPSAPPDQGPAPQADNPFLPQTPESAPAPVNSPHDQPGALDAAADVGPAAPASGPVELDRLSVDSLTAQLDGQARTADITAHGVEADVHDATRTAQVSADSVTAHLDGQARTADITSEGLDVAIDDAEPPPSTAPSWVTTATNDSTDTVGPAAPGPAADPADLDAAAADAQAGAEEAARTLQTALDDISDADKQMLHDHLQAAADELTAQLNAK